MLYSSRVHPDRARCLEDGPIRVSVSLSWFGPFYSLIVPRGLYFVAFTFSLRLGKVCDRDTTQTPLPGTLVWFHLFSRSRRQATSLHPSHVEKKHNNHPLVCIMPPLICAKSGFGKAVLGLFRKKQSRGRGPKPEQNIRPFPEREYETRDNDDYKRWADPTKSWNGFR